MDVRDFLPPAVREECEKYVEADAAVLRPRYPPGPPPTDHAVHNCDSCGRRVAVGGELSRCELCNFDLCPECVAAAPAAAAAADRELGLAQRQLVREVDAIQDVEDKEFDAQGFYARLGLLVC
eukprot:gene10996-3777_t